jgi:hypothetical protein
MKKTICTSRWASVRRSHSRAARGSAILGIIGLMLIVSVLGVTLLTYLSSSSEGSLVTDAGNQSFFMAESGARYAIARILEEGTTAASALDGRRFTLTGGRAFDLAVEVQHPTGVTRYCIDCTGVSGAGTPLERSTLNGYVIDVATISPSVFSVAAQITQSTGRNAVELSGSAYIDSYDSGSSATQWTTRGQYNDATVSVGLTRDVASLAWSTGIYGDLRVGTGADVGHPTTIVNRPGNILGDQGILASPVPSAAAVPPPTEAAEVAAPSHLTTMPTFLTYGTRSIPGGDYSVAVDFTPGSAALTVSGSTYVRVGDDIEIGSGGSISVNGNLAASVNDVLNIAGGTVGLTVTGNGDLRAGGTATVSNGSAMRIAGTLDLDVVGNLAVTGNSLMQIGGNADIDVGGKFILANSARLRIAGAVVLRVATGFEVTGNAAIIFDPGGSLQVYVQSGSVVLSNSVSANPAQTASRFVIVGTPAVSAVTISGNVPVYAGIYAPGAAVTISGSSALFGALVGRTLDVSGTSALHFDQALQRSSIGGGGGGGTPTTDLSILRRFWVAAGS